ncbi:MAG: hypothetical protein KAH77_05955, partial [Thiomargarita sp.]|nr:hypothetical protein [Thiomargarita sp.]
NELAWNYPTIAVFKNAKPIAELSILTVFEIITDDVPERKKIHHELTEIYPYPPVHILSWNLKITWMCILLKKF